MAVKKINYNLNYSVNESNIQNQEYSTSLNNLQDSVISWVNNKFIKENVEVSPNQNESISHKNSDELDVHSAETFSDFLIVESSYRYFIILR